MTEPKWEYRIVGPNAGGVPFTGTWSEAKARLESYDDYWEKWGHLHKLQRRPIPAWEDVLVARRPKAKETQSFADKVNGAVRAGHQAVQIRDGSWVCRHRDCAWTHEDFEHRDHPYVDANHISFIERQYADD